MNGSFLPTSVPDPYSFDTNPDPDLFFIGFQVAKIFFGLITLITVGIFTSAFKDKRLFRNLNTAEIKFFFNVLMKGSGSVQIITNPDSGSPKTYEFYGCRTQREEPVMKGTT